MARRSQRAARTDRTKDRNRNSGHAYGGGGEALLDFDPAEPVGKRAKVQPVRGTDSTHSPVRRRLGHPYGRQHRPADSRAGPGAYLRAIPPRYGGRGCPRTWTWPQSRPRTRAPAWRRCPSRPFGRAVDGIRSPVSGRRLLDRDRAGRPMRTAGIIGCCLIGLATVGRGDDDFLDRVDDALTLSGWHDQLRVRLSGALDLE